MVCVSLVKAENIMIRWTIRLFLVLLSIVVFLESSGVKGFVTLSFSTSSPRRVVVLQPSWRPLSYTIPHSPYAKQNYKSKPTLSSGGLTLLHSSTPSTKNKKDQQEDEEDQQTTTSTTSAKIEEGLRSKLLTETIAPWRGLRLFLYFALGSGALIGGLITLSGTIAALSESKPDMDLSKEYMNLAIDFGAVLIFILLARFDLQKNSELSQEVIEKVQKTKERNKQVQSLKQREQQLYSLKLSVQVSPMGETRDASVKELQVGAKQHMIVVAGPKKACRDALVGANLLKMDFALTNVLVVPYDVDVGTIEARSRPGRGGATGFGERPAFEAQPYVSWPVGEGWDEYINAEMQDAVVQNGEKAREEGIAIVVANNGKIIRRGVGKVPWRQMVEELEQSVK